MNKFIVLAIVLFFAGGYYLYEDQKEKKLAKLICSEHFNTSEKICLEEYWNYAFRLSGKIAEKNLPEYKKKIQSIENKISLLEYDLENFNALEYEPLTLSDLGLPNEFNKVIISHKDTGDFFDISCGDPFKYEICLSLKTFDYNNDQDVINTEVVEITNMENFPEIKIILDELHDHNFNYYKMIVYGDFEKGFINSKIKADFIKLEKFDLKDRVYQKALNDGIIRIKQHEFEKYFKNKFPNKTIPKITNSVLYK